MGNTWTTANIAPNAVKGKTIIVTGANSGTGYFTALELGIAGAHVILACRSKERGEQAVKELKERAPNATFELQLLDLSDLSDVKRFAEDFGKRTNNSAAVDIIINNAGIMKPPFAKSKDGFESQLATNHLGHFALIKHMMPFLEKSSSPRIVVVSSLAAYRGAKTFSASNPSAVEIDFTKKNGEGYNPDAIYAETKLANLLFIKQLSKRYPKLTCVASHPGITASNLWQYNSKQNALKMFMQSSENGALPIIRAATEPQEKLVSGESYFAPRGCGVAGAPVGAWWPKLALDEEFAKRYWEASAKATGVDY